MDSVVTLISSRHLYIQLFFPNFVTTQKIVSSLPELFIHQPHPFMFLLLYKLIKNKINSHGNFKGVIVKQSNNQIQYSRKVH